VWPDYDPSGEKTIAKLAYNGNVEPSNFVETVGNFEIVSGFLSCSWFDAKSGN